MMSTMVTSDTKICSKFLLIEPQPFKEVSDATSINCTMLYLMNWNNAMITNSGIKSEYTCSVPSD